MLLSELKTKLEENTITDLERKAHVGNLLQHFTPVSIKTIQDFQLGWNFSRDQSEFFTNMHKVILDCILLEQSELGLMVREQFDKEELLDTLEL